MLRIVYYKSLCTFLEWGRGIPVLITMINRIKCFNSTGDTVFLNQNKLF